jgi:hypothetical protein
VALVTVQPAGDALGAAAAAAAFDVSARGGGAVGALPQPGNSVATSKPPQRLRVMACAMLVMAMPPSRKS